MSERLRRDALTGDLDAIRMMARELDRRNESALKMRRSLLRLWVENGGSSLVIPSGHDARGNAWGGLTSIPRAVWHEELLPIRVTEPFNVELCWGQREARAYAGFVAERLVRAYAPVTAMSPILRVIDLAVKRYDVRFHMWGLIATDPGVISMDKDALRALGVLRDSRGRASSAATFLTAIFNGYAYESAIHAKRAVNLLNASDARKCDEFNVRLVLGENDA